MKLSWWGSVPMYLALKACVPFLVASSVASYGSPLLCRGKTAQMSRSQSSCPVGDRLVVGLNLGGWLQGDSLLPAMHFKCVQGREIGNSAIEIAGP